MRTPSETSGSIFSGNDCWLRSYEWAIDQMACPAFCCTPQGTVFHSNRSARRLWNCSPDPAHPDCWDGFAALYDLHGAQLAKSVSPSAIAAATASVQAPVELIAEAAGGERRHVVFHARPILAPDGTVVGVLCSLTDVSERRRLEGEVGQANENRDLFLRILAHELRNPLSPIMTVAQLMERISTQPEIVRLAGIVERQTHQLSRFITDLLDASRIDRCCDIPIVRRMTTVGEVVKRAEDVAASPVRSRRQTVHADVADPELALQCDPERLAQALGNLLLNASQYSGDGADIVLTVSADAPLLEVQVADPGIGAAPHQLPDLFKPFRKFAQYPGRIASGAGVGLTIVKGICDAHGGIASAHSEGPGMGMRLRLVLPVVKDD